MSRRRTLAVAVAVGIAVLALVLLLGGGDDGPDDPLAFRDDRTGAFERGAAAGLSHVLYAKSPGGATTTARRTAMWREQIEDVAAQSDSDPDLLEALVFLESAGRPEVVAGADPEGATGLTQILAETGVNLLGMRIDLSASRSLTRRIDTAERRGDAGAADELRAERRRIDERFDPEKALAATGRYLGIARERFGREDLAIASYHMGIGNLERALRAYADADTGAIAEVVEEHELTYARLFFDSTPELHADAYELLARLGDDSSTYLWRVLAGREIMRLHRQDPDELRRLEELHDRKASAEEVLHPRTDTGVFQAPVDLRDALDDGELVTLPRDATEVHFAVDPQMGELAPRVGGEARLYQALRPEALALLTYLAAGVERVSGDSPLTITSTVRDARYQRILGSRNREATSGYSLHTTGYAFDVLREYRTREQALALEFWLTRLRAMNLIAWVREPAAIHVTVSAEAKRLVP